MKLIKPLTIGLLFAVSLGSTALAVPTRLQGQQQTTPRSTGFGGPTGLRDQCPAGQQPSSWQKPIYDEDGLFVIGWETVATCIPEGLQPAG